MVSSNKEAPIFKTMFSVVFFYLHVADSFLLIYSKIKPGKKPNIKLVVSDKYRFYFKLCRIRPCHCSILTCLLPPFFFFTTTSLWMTDNVCNDPLSFLCCSVTRQWLVFLCEEDVMIFFLCLRADGIGINPAQAAGEGDLLVSFRKVFLQKAAWSSFQPLLIPFCAVISSEFDKAL